MPRTSRKLLEAIDRAREKREAAARRWAGLVAIALCAIAALALVSAAAVARATGEGRTKDWDVEWGARAKNGSSGALRAMRGEGRLSAAQPPPLPSP